MTNDNDYPPGWMERWGHRRIEADVAQLARTHGARDEPAIGERSLWRSVWGAAAVGFFFSGLVAIFEIRFFQSPLDFHAAYWWHTSLYLLAAIAFTGVETYFLIVFGLRTTARLARSVAPPYEPPTVRSLCRAVVEIPEPDLRPLGLDPEKHVRRESEILWYLAYRVKFMASNMIAKMIMRRLLTRAGFRGLAPLIAAPVVAVWNAWVMYLVLTEAKHRLMGWMAVREIADTARRAAEAGNAAFHRAVTMLASIRLVLYDTYNHNFDHLLRALHARYEGGEPPPLDDRDALRAALAGLSEADRAEIGRHALVLFALKRKRPSRRERALLAELGIDAAALIGVKRHIRALDTRALLADLHAAPPDTADVAAPDVAAATA